MTSHQPGGKLTKLDNFYHRKDNTLCLFQLVIILSVDLFFLSCSASAKTTIHGLTKYLIHYPVISYSITSDLGIHSQRSMAVGSFLRKSLILPCYLSPWSTWPDRIVKWHLKWTWSANEVAKSWKPEAELSRRCMFSQSAFNMHYSSSHSQDSQAQEIMVEIEMVLLTIIPSNPLAKSLLPVPATLGPTCLLDYPAPIM